MRAAALSPGNSWILFLDLTLSSGGSRRAARRLKWSRVTVRRIQGLARGSTEIQEWEARRRQESLLHKE